MSYLSLQIKALWLKVAIWVATMSGITILVAVMMGELYGNPFERMSMRMAMDSPAMTAMAGPVPPGEFTEATLFMVLMILFLGLAYGLYNILIANQVIKHEENDGLTELLIASGIGRKSLFVKHVIVGIMINVPFFVVTLLGLSLVNLNGSNFDGHLLFVGAVTLFGLLFYAITMMIGAFVATSDLTFGLSLAILIGFYLYRAITDVVDTGYSVMSPYHWLSRLDAYGGNNVIWLFPFAFIIVFIAIAYLVTLKRDVNDGIIKAKTKRKTKNITTYPKLLLNQSRLLIFAWIAALIIMGLSYGAVLEDIEDIMSSNFIMSAAVETGQVDNPVLFFISMISIITAIVAMFPGLMIIGKLLKEEKYRLEWMLSGVDASHLNRRTILITHIILAVIVSLIGHALYLASLYSMSLIVDDFQAELLDFFYALVSEGSAIVLILGLAVLLYGISYKLFKVIWPITGFLFIISYVGTILQFPEWVLFFSPFYHLGHIFIDGPVWGTIITLYVIGIILMIIGTIAYQRRDLTNG